MKVCWNWSGKMVIRDRTVAAQVSCLIEQLCRCQEVAPCSTFPQSPVSDDVVRRKRPRSRFRVGWSLPVDSMPAMKKLPRTSWLGIGYSKPKTPPCGRIPQTRSEGVLALSNKSCDESLSAAQVEWSGKVWQEEPNHKKKYAVIGSGTRQTGRRSDARQHPKDDSQLGTGRVGPEYGGDSSNEREKQSRWLDCCTGDSLPGSLGSSGSSGSSHANLAPPEGLGKGWRCRSRFHFNQLLCTAFNFAHRLAPVNASGRDSRIAIWVRISRSQTTLPVLSKVGAAPDLLDF